MIRQKESGGSLRNREQIDSNAAAGARGAVQPRVLAILAGITLVALGYLIFNRLDASLEERKRNHGEALRVAESALQLEFQRLRTPANWRSETIAGTGSAATLLQKQVLDSARIEITASAEIEGVRRQIHCLVRRSVDSDSSLAVMTWDEK